MRVQESELERMDLLCRSLLAELPGSSMLLLDPALRVRIAEGPALERVGLRTDLVAGRPLDELFSAAPFAQAEPHLRAELERRLAQQSAVARLGELALGGVETGILLTAAAQAVADALGVELVYVLEHEGDGRMAVRAGVGWDDGLVGSSFEMLSYGDERRRNVYRRGPVVIEDLPNDRGLRARPLRAHGVVSGVTVSVGDGAAPFGLLGAYTRVRRTFDGHDLDFLQAVAHVLSTALEQRRTEERLRHDALHDGLTGLPNRALLLDRLGHALARAQRDGRSIALFCLDLDHLKIVNDSLGHGAGDELLRSVGPRLREVLRPSDTIARFGGDEFAVLCEGVSDEGHAVRVADRLVAAFDAPFTVDGAARFAGASVGVVVAGPGGDRTPEELLADADAAMYRAKDLGRGRHELFDAALRARVRERLRVEDDLRRTLAGVGGGELWLAYQPFYRVADRTVAGVEALVRWQHPERGLVPPGEFIPVAEDSGLVVALGEHVLRTACRQVARWRADLQVPDLTLTVNVSARQVAAPGLVETVEAALAESGLAPEALGLEITEGLLLEQSAATAETLRALRDLGVRLVLDDFGTGYSSLGYLMRYPLDGLKVDRAFIADLGEDGLGDGAIVEAIVGMARALGMRIIPEGVESEGQLERLAELGCDFAQGFHLARPQPAEAIAALLATRVACDEALGPPVRGAA